MVQSCHHESRKAAENNTIYANGVSGININLLKEIDKQSSAEKAIEVCGWPIWIRELPSRKALEEISEFKKINLATGSFRLFYTKQKNSSLDFISISILVENGKVVDIQNEWYHE